MDIEYYKKYEPIDGKWYINKELGRGAFGTVFEIERRDFTNAKSALKVITIPASPSEVKSYREENFDMDEQSVTSYFYGFVEEFIKEFEVMLQLKGNSNIVSIEDYDVKKHTDEIGWDIFIRMELLSPMNIFFMNNGPTPNEVIKLGIDICKALEVCQRYNIVHRDIKPSNIFVSDACEFKLGDFGVARTLEKTSSGLSKKGTYTYMAPEVFKNDAYGTNVDIYSLGIVMYKLLNKNMEPFRTERTHSDEEKALGLRMNGEIIPAPSCANGRLAEIILKACSYNPKDRYESPLQMREELENILHKDDEKRPVEFVEEKKIADDVINADDDETVGLFGDRSIESSDETRELSGLAVQFPEWAEMIAELTDREVLSRINDVDEWTDEFRILCEEEYFKRTGKWISKAVISTTQDDENDKKKTEYKEPTWQETIAELSDEELLERCNSEDEWQEEYIELCYKEAARRNLDLDTTFDIPEVDAAELNFYEIQNINTILSELSPDELRKKKEFAEKALTDRKISSKEKAISEYILYYFEQQFSSDDEDSTVGIFD